MKNNGFDEYNEKKRHGNAAFPVQLYAVDRRHPQYVMPLHWHKEPELIRVTCGQLSLFINNTEYLLTAGDIAFINGKRLHRAEPKECCYDCVVFDPQVMAQKYSEIYTEYLYPLLSGTRCPDCVYPREETALYAALERIFEALKEKPPHYKLELMENLFVFLKELYRNERVFSAKPSKASIHQTRYISELLSWLEQNCAEHISLEEMAQRVGITPNYLCRIFKSYTGMTPTEYINRLRVQRICHEIKWGEKSITQAALDNGYNDISYFCKVFKKVMGVSAREYAQSPSLQATSLML